MVDMSRMGFRGSAMMPIMEAIVTIPTLMVSGAGRVARVINNASRMALKKELLFHHKRRIPEHFNKWRQRKYRYQPRSERVAMVKRRRNQADLVKTRRTKNKMVSTMKVMFPRSGDKGVVFIRGHLPWPAGFRFSGTASRGVTPEVMADEISRWTLQEERTAAVHVRDNWVENLRQNLSKRAKLKVGPQLAALGIKV